MEFELPVPGMRNPLDVMAPGVTCAGFQTGLPSRPRSRTGGGAPVWLLGSRPGLLRGTFEPKYILDFSELKLVFGI